MIYRYLEHSQQYQNDFFEMVIMNFDWFSKNIENYTSKREMKMSVSIRNRHRGEKGIEWLSGSTCYIAYDQKNRFNLKKNFQRNSYEFIKELRSLIEYSFYLKMSENGIWCRDKINYFFLRPFTDLYQMLHDHKQW